MTWNKKWFLLCSLLGVVNAQEFSWQEMLGQVTDHSILVNAVPEFAADVLIEYGISGSLDTLQSPIQSYQKGDVIEVKLDGLSPSSSYFYRLKYRISGTSTFLNRSMHSFHTARRTGEPYIFTIQADPHLDVATDSATYLATQLNIAKDKPDFLIDLGDTFLSEKYNKVQDTLHARIKLARSWYDHITHSIPLMLTIGNHEGELGWLNNNTDTCFPVRAAKERVKYYPNPKPDDFYTGDTAQTPFVGQREAWYAWTWGDALFVVIDPYWNAKKNKGTGIETGWSFTLGSLQYEWLKKTLRESKAKFKFVFSHQLVGGDEPFVNGVTQGTGRGGAKWADLYEMGGKNKDGTDVWATLRPGWEKPLHALFLETGVNIFFHGHDHLFSMEEKDGVIYQECPQPGLANHTVAGNADVYGYLTNIIPNSGHLRIRVDGDSAKVEYIRSFAPLDENAQTGWINGVGAFSYTLTPQGSTVTALKPILQNHALMVNHSGHQVQLSYELNQNARVSLTVMDFEGRVIQRIVDQEQVAGSHAKTWISPSSGEYMAFLNVNGQIKTQRFVIP